MRPVLPCDGFESWELGAVRGYKTENVHGLWTRGAPPASLGWTPSSSCCFLMWKFLPDLGVPAQISLSRCLGILRTQHVAGHQHTERCVFPWTSIAPSLCPTPARCRFAAGLDITSDTSEVKVKVVRGESAVGPSCPLAGRWLAALLCCGLLSLLVLFGSSDFCLNSMRWAFLLDINFFLNN